MIFGQGGSRGKKSGSAHTDETQLVGKGAVAVTEIIEAGWSGGTRASNWLWIAGEHRVEKAGL